MKTRTIEAKYNPWLDGGEPDPNPEPEPDPPWALKGRFFEYDDGEHATWRIRRKPKSLSDL